MQSNEFIHLLKSAISDFQRNKVRTFLTSLGITIGVLSVVLLIALGLGLKNYIKQQFESLGSNLLFVRGGGELGEGGLGGSFGSFVGGLKFDEKDLASLRKLSNVDYIVPFSYSTAVIETETEKKYTNIVGSNEESFIVLNQKPLVGDIYTRTDVTKGSKVVTLGYNLASDLFDNPEDALGRTVRITNQRFKVIGVMKKIGDPDQDTAANVPYKSIFGSINADKNFIFIYLGVNSEDNIPEVKTEAEKILSKRYDEDDFTIFEQEELLSTINTIFSVINSVLVAIGSISLIVGGIGIMNIMYATVTERIKEVGIRRAVGATKRDILLQFLTESVVLSLLGGTIGLVVSIIIVMIVKPFFPVSVNLFAVVITFSISSAIGIFFGVFPARRAANLPPIEAIRYE